MTTIIFTAIIATIVLVALASRDKSQSRSRGDGSESLLVGTAGSLDSGKDASHHHASHGGHGHGSFDGGHGGFDAGGHH